LSDDHSQVSEHMALGGDIDHVHGQEQWTPLVHAASGSEARHLAAATLLVSKGADVDHIDKRGRNALHMAVTEQNAAVIKALLPLTKNVNAHDGNAVSTLLVATRNGDVALVQQLLQFGADPLQQDRFGGSAYRHAKETGSPAMRAALGVPEPVVAAPVMAGSDL